MPYPEGCPTTRATPSKSKHGGNASSSRHVDSRSTTSTTGHQVAIRRATIRHGRAWNNGKGCQDQNSSHSTGAVFGGRRDKS